MDKPDEVQSPLYLNPSNPYEEALFPLLRAALQQGYNVRDREIYTAQEVESKALSAAFEAGAESMADQISEDFFGGRQNFKRQFLNPYSEELT